MIICFLKVKRLFLRYQEKIIPVINSPVRIT